MKEIKIVAEIYSRVSGYFRPVKQWNSGKQEEFAARKMLKIDHDIVKDPKSKVENK